MKFLIPGLFLIFLSACATSKVETVDSSPRKKGLDAELSTYSYPFEVHEFRFRSQNQDLKMAYMDIKPAQGEKETIVLLHGKNFSGYYFEDMIKILNGKGYRVVVPDQVGFGKSSKPKVYQYSFQTLADNTHQLLQSLKINNYQVLGHSMGGMLATRMSLMFPNEVQKLFLVNPIGLEDWKTMTSYRTIDQNYQSELNSSPDRIRNYQKESYYDGQWKPEYERLIQVPIGWLEGPDYPLIAWNAALTSDMVFTQPVYYEFKDLKMPTVLVIGQRDRTAIGKASAPENMKKKMGNYPAMGRQVKQMIPKGQLVEIPGLGHLPFIEDPVKFWRALESHLVP